MRPVRAVAVVLTVPTFWTTEPTSSATTWSGCRTIPWSLIGCTTPAGVTKLRSTTTGVDVGLSNDTYSPFDPAVEPPAKNHAADVVLWHGDTDQPDGRRHHLAHRHPSAGHRHDGRQPRTRRRRGHARDQVAARRHRHGSVLHRSGVGLLAHRGGHGTAGRVGQEQKARSAARRGGLSGAIPRRGLCVGRADQRGGYDQRADRRRRSPRAGRHPHAGDDDHDQHEHPPAVLAALVGRRHARPCCGSDGTPGPPEEGDQQDHPGQYLERRRRAGRAETARAAASPCPP